LKFSDAGGTGALKICPSLFLDFLFFIFFFGPEFPFARPFGDFAQKLALVRIALSSFRKSYELEQMPGPTVVDMRIWEVTAC
jgi:hypothetical protein